MMRAEVSLRRAQGTSVVNLHRHDGLLGAEPEPNPGSPPAAASSGTAPVSGAAGSVPEAQALSSAPVKPVTGSNAKLSALESLAWWRGTRAVQLAEELLDMTPEQRAQLRADYQMACPWAED